MNTVLNITENIVVTAVGGLRTILLYYSVVSLLLIRPSRNDNTKKLRLKLLKRRNGEEVLVQVQVLPGSIAYWTCNGRN